MSRGGRLVLGVGCSLLAVVVGLWARGQGWHLTEGELLTNYWPAWLLVIALVGAAAVLLGEEIR